MQNVGYCIHDYEQAANNLKQQVYAGLCRTLDTAYKQICTIVCTCMYLCYLDFRANIEVRYRGSCCVVQIDVTLHVCIHACVNVSIMHQHVCETYVYCTYKVTTYSPRMYQGLPLLRCMYDISYTKP